MRRFNFIFIAAIVILFSGCAGMNSDFACNGKSPQMCQPIDNVNKVAEEGVFTNNSNNNVVINNTQYENVSLSGYTLPTPQPGEPIRYGESVQKIWIAPFEDSHDNYHESSYLYTVINKSHWVGTPAKEIIQADY